MNQAIVWWMATIDRIFFFSSSSVSFTVLHLKRSDPSSNWLNMINMIPKQPKHKETTVRRTKTETNNKWQITHCTCLSNIWWPYLPCKEKRCKACMRKARFSDSGDPPSEDYHVGWMIFSFTWMIDVTSSQLDWFTWNHPFALALL